MQIDRLNQWSNIKFLIHHFCGVRKRRLPYKTQFKKDFLDHDTLKYPTEVPLKFNKEFIDGKKF